MHQRTSPLYTLALAYAIAFAFHHWLGAGFFTFIFSLFGSMVHVVHAAKQNYAMAQSQYWHNATETDEGIFSAEILRPAGSILRAVPRPRYYLFAVMPVATLFIGLFRMVLNWLLPRIDAMVFDGPFGWLVIETLFLAFAYFFCFFVFGKLTFTVEPAFINVQREFFFLRSRKRIPYDTRTSFKITSDALDLTDAKGNIHKTTVLAFTKQIKETLLKIGFREQ